MRHQFRDYVHGHACAAEHRIAAENFRIADNQTASAAQFAQRRRQLASSRRGSRRSILIKPISTAEDIVRRISAQCAYVDERSAIGIRPEPAAAIVRQYGEQFRRAAALAPASAGENPSHALIYSVERRLIFAPNLCNT